MTLPASGAISLNDVNVELNKSATAQITMNDSDVRSLFGKVSGTISLADGYGKATPITWTYISSSVANGTTINAPTGTQAGDLLVLFKRPIGTVNTTPTNFTEILTYNQTSTGNYSMRISYRNFVSGDSTSIGLGQTARAIMGCFRPNKAVSTVTVNSPTQITGAGSPKNTSASAVGVSSISFTALTHSTGSTTTSFSANSTSLDPTNFHLSADDRVLGAYFGINASISLSGTDSSSALMQFYSFTLSFL